MKRQVRRGVFETNSSSTHSITICSKSEFEAWKRGELLYDMYDENLIDPNSLTDKNDIGEDYQTYDGWNSDYDLNIYKREYTTDGGEEIVAFGKYGYDG